MAHCAWLQSKLCCHRHRFPVLVAGFLVIGTLFSKQNRSGDSDRGSARMQSPHLRPPPRRSQHCWRSENWAPHSSSWPCSLAQINVLSPAHYSFHICNPRRNFSMLTWRQEPRLKSLALKIKQLAPQERGSGVRFQVSGLVGGKSSSSCSEGLAAPCALRSLLARRVIMEQLLGQTARRLQSKPPRLTGVHGFRRSVSASTCGQHPRLKCLRSKIKQLAPQECGSGVRFGGAKI